MMVYKIGSPKRTVALIKAMLLKPISPSRKEERH